MNNSKISILHIIATLEMGGAEMVVVNLINALHSEFDLHVCCVEKGGPLAKKIPKTIPIHYLNKKGGNDVTIPFKISKIIKANKIQIVHSHNWEVFCEATWGANFGRVKAMIHTAHGDLEYHYAKNRIKKFLRRSLEKISATNVNLIVAVSNLIRAQIISSLSLSCKKVITIHNGANPSDSRTKSKSMNALPGVDLISVGRLCPVKNFPMLIKAFYFAQKKTIVPIRFNIVGDGPDRQSLENMVEKLNLKEKIHFMGFRNDVDALLPQHDIFLNGSRYEGISLGILEAMNAGLTVIATSVGGNIELIENQKSGILVPDDDHCSMAERIVELVEDHTKRKMYRNNALSRIDTEFNFQKNVSKYIAHYRYVLSSRSNHGAIGGGAIVQKNINDSL